ncbi:MAG: peroxiredoxin [Acidobacteriota bacterium]
MFWELFSVVFLVLFAFGAGAAGPLTEGSPFPQWELVDQQGQKVSSKDLAGKTYLLWFYPKAMTSGCTREGCELRDHYAEFRKLGVEILGVSFDTPADNARFAAEQRFPFRLLSDSSRQLAVQVGAADSPEASYPKRVSFLVGGDGRVLKVYPKVDPATHAQEVLKDLQSLK